MLQVALASATALVAALPVGSLASTGEFPGLAMVLRPVVLLAVWPVGLALRLLGLQVECQAGLLALLPVVELVWESLVGLMVVSRGLLVVLGLLLLFASGLRVELV